jgi:hypothetical protein
MTINLEADVNEQFKAMDPTTWTALQTEICMNVANAKFYAFVAEAERISHDYVRLGVVPKQTAADYLHQTAIYNQLYYEYGVDRIEQIMSAALASEAA